MLDRALKAIIVLTLAVFAGQLVFGILCAVLGGVLSAAAKTGGVFSHVLGAVAIVVFAVGLGVRLLHWIRSLGLRQRGGRAQGQSEWGGRSFADEVPVDRRNRRPRRRD
jgi:hypothetical protein